MKIPTIEQANNMLQEAKIINPGPWVAHSLNTAEAARIIASKLPEINEDYAYILGLLHDIGRRYGVTDLRHVLDGYQYLCSQGYEDAAQICLTHSFPLQDTGTFAGDWDCTENEKQIISKMLQSFTYTIYDRLIQLCDCIAMPSGFCLMEIRFIDVAMRRGLNENFQERWQAYFDLRDEFSHKLGYSIYQLLPGIVENTFHFSIQP
jgi:hypothetical protein